MISKKNRAVEMAMNDVEVGKWKLEEVLGVLYDNGSVDAATQIIGTDDPMQSAMAIALEPLLGAQDIREVA